jgi:catechol 2,3-dioxygenase-like lactoylglutathione lyase family enzyme
MGARLTSAVVQIFARDVRRSIGFYRQLGLPVPEPDGPDPHVDVALPGGNRLSFDAEQTITGMHPDWTPSDGSSG